MANNLAQIASSRAARNLARSPAAKQRRAPTRNSTLAALSLMSDALKRGEPVQILASQLRSQDLLGAYSDEEIYALVIAKRTLARRIAKGEALTREEADKAWRLARIWTEAERVFGDPAKVQRWLRDENPVFARQTPLQMLQSEAGAAAVEELLGQIDHGMFI